MKIITLKGAKNSGKTTALRNLYQQLLNMTDSRCPIEYINESNDYCDFTAYFVLNGKKIVIKTVGDAITWVRQGFGYAKSKDADVLINAWTSHLDEKYDIQTELPSAIIIENPITLSTSLRAEWQAFNNDVISRM